MIKTEANRAYRKSGWCSFTIPERTILDRIVEKKSAYLQGTCDVVSQAFNVPLTTFRKEDLEAFELAKSSFRGLIRYDLDVVTLANHVARWINSNISPTGKAIYYNQLYPIIHFPRDYSEAGSLHIDATKDSAEYHNIWLPLNPCFGKPISIIDRSHTFTMRSVNRLLVKLRARTKSNLIPEYVGKMISPDAGLGTGFSWNGFTSHTGNLNVTDQPTVALVMKVTEKPILLESTCSLNEKSDFSKIADSYVDPKEFTKKYLSIHKEIAKAERSFEEPNESLIHRFERTSEIIESWRLTDIEKKRIAFALLLYVQRMSAPQASKKSDYWVYDMFSAAMTKENPFCFSRVLNHFEKTTTDSSQILSLIEYYVEKCSSVQLLYLISQFANRQEKKFQRDWAKITVRTPAPLLAWA